MKALVAWTLGLTLLSTTHAFGAVLAFWDTNGSTPGAGGTAPTGTWGVDAYWNEDSTGGGANGGTRAWHDGDYAVFAADDDATGAYTVNVSGIVDVADIHVDLGQVTFAPAHASGDSLKLGSLLSVGGKTDAAVARYNVPLTASTNVYRYKRGTLIFGATNTLTGTFTIEGGVVQFAVPYALGGVTPLALANNDPTRGDYNPAWQYTPAVFHSGGLDQQLGTLSLTGTDPSVQRILDLGNGSGTLAFADSSGQDWGSFTLTITNYALGRSKLQFGTTSAGLTATQLGQIQFADFANLPGQIDSSGCVAPVLPRITQVTPWGSSVEVDWTAVNNRHYRLYSKDTLSTPDWDLQGDAYGNGDTASYTDWNPSTTGRYYRVEALPQ
jgi:autotransporter-associated beta strand protein